MLGFILEPVVLVPHWNATRSGNFIFRVGNKHEKAIISFDLHCSFCVFSCPKSPSNNISKWGPKKSPLGPPVGTKWLQEKFRIGFRSCMFSRATARASPKMIVVMWAFRK